MSNTSLSHEELLPDLQGSFEDFGEKCGVFAVFEPDSNVALTTYNGLYALKHRGQDAAGQVVGDEYGELFIYKDLGSVQDVFKDGEALPLLLPSIGRMAIGHNRYGTMARVPTQERWHAAQPIKGQKNNFAGAYNGDVSNIRRIMSQHEFSTDSYVSDTEGVIKLIDLYMSRSQEPTLINALHQVLPQLEGAYSGVFTDGKRIVGVRDPNGFRPFVYGQTATGGHVLASEVRALDESGAEFKYEVAPGTMIIIDEKGVHTERFAKDCSTPCMYEYFYFSKEDNIFHNQKVGDVKSRFGEELAREHPIDADLVVGVPNSGITAAEAYAKALNLPYIQAVTKNKNRESDLRSFLANNQNEREAIALAKFLIDGIEVKDKSIVVVDDSVIRGTVSRVLIQMLREAGATSVHVRVPAPIYKYSCYYGMDTGRAEELLATSRNLSEMCETIGADSLEFLSPAGVVKAVQRPMGKICIACATGEYPTEVPVTLLSHK